MTPAVRGRARAHLAAPGARGRPIHGGLRMIHHDLDDWPLAISIATGPSTPAATAALLATWTCWLARGGRLGVLRLGTGEAGPADADDASPGIADWLHAQAGPIGRQLLGLAAVAPAASLARAIHL